MVVVESGTKGLGKWIKYQINIKESFKKHFGLDINEIDGIAIMTDTDNTKTKATALFGDIKFRK